MKEWNDAALAAMANGTALAHGAVYIGCAPDPLAVWGGYGAITLPDDVAYQGIGDRGLVSASGAELGGTEQNITLTLSGVDPDNAVAFNATALRDSPVILWRLISDLAGNVLDAQIYTRGRLDQIPRELAEDGTFTFNAMVESAARGLGRAGGRQASGADQHLIDPPDTSLDQQSSAGEITLYWGGQKPASAASAVAAIPSD